jgi:arylsulfatase A-like enzyme
MSRLRFNGSPTQALVWFWPFQSLPRLWYLSTSPIPAGAEPLLQVALPLAVGFLRDGLLVAGLLLPIQIAQWLGGEQWIPGRVRRGVAALFSLVLALLLAALFAEMEFLRYLGFHSTLAHLPLAEDWERLQSSVRHSLGPLAVPLALTPTAFLAAITAIRLDAVDRGLRTGRGVLVSAAILAVGVAAGRIPVPDPLVAAVSENYFVSVIRSAWDQDDWGGQRGLSIAEILDTAPLADGDVAMPPWRHLDSRYPLVKATDHHRCRLGVLDAGTCARDADGDGHALEADCNDLEPGIHPGADDIPRNGIDEDCSGLDADPPNVIFIHWEGVRAVNVGSIGYATPATPRFDALVRDGRLFSDAYANGTQTRWSLISVYCSTLPRLSDQWIFRHNPDLELLCLPEILQRRGYRTLYVHGGTIGFAGKGPRMRRWFQTRFDRSNAPIRSMPRFNWGARDRDVLAFAYDMLRRRDDPAPFFLTIATLAVHHPFGLPEARFAIGRHTDRRNQLANVIRYTDDALGEFLEKLLADPEFENTIVLVASDHGINWFDPHPEGRQSVLWEDLVWVPVALLGDAWGVVPGVDAQVRQLADITPTVLDRLGIELPNPFVGHSLLRDYGEREPRAFFATANGGPSAGVRVGRYKFFERLGSGQHFLFDVVADRRESTDLSGDPLHAERVAELRVWVADLYRQNERLIEENRIWTDRYRLARPEAAQRGAAERSQKDVDAEGSR